MPTSNPPVRGMWPFQELSLSAATTWANAATVLFAACVLGGLVAAFVLIRASNVKEHRLEAAGAQSRERIGALEAELGKAQAAVADANGRAQEAQAELAKNKAARVATSEQPSPPNGRAPAIVTQSPVPDGARALTDQQVQSLIQRMSAFGRHHVTVGASPVTLESGRFADQRARQLAASA